MKHALIAPVLVLWLAAGAAAADRAVVVINAPDGPTLRTREEIATARQAGASSIEVRITNVALVQDEDLMALIEQEMTDLLTGRGFAPGQISFKRCTQACLD